MEVLQLSLAENDSQKEIKRLSRCAEIFLQILIRKLEKHPFQNDQNSVSGQPRFQKHKEILNNGYLSDDAGLSSCELENEKEKEAKEKMKKIIFAVDKEKQNFHSNFTNLTNVDVEMKTETTEPSTNQLSKFEQYVQENQNNLLFQPFSQKTNNKEISLAKKYFADDNFEVKEVLNGLINEPFSNLNSYGKKFIPKALPSKENIKSLIPFLKEFNFNPKFLKKENIDKKIIRKFRKFVIHVFKNSIERFENYDYDFWVEFSTKNLLPPLKFFSTNKVWIEFKSFNNNYLLWLFSKSGSTSLYKEFTNQHSEELLADFTDLYNQNNSKEEGMMEKIKTYLFNLDDIYAPRVRTSENSSSYLNSNLSVVQNSEIVYDEFIGYLSMDNKIFYLNNFNNKQKRCLSKFDDKKNDVEMDVDKYGDLNDSCDSILDSRNI